MAFFMQTEGFRTDAYCLSPASTYPNSGVTIGLGIDMGSKNAASFTSVGVSQAIVNQLSRYFGLKGQAACNAVASFKVVLSQADAMDLSTKMLASYTNAHATWYNRDKAAAAKAFDALTCAQRTVISSVLYQYGSPQVKTLLKNFNDV